MRLEKRFQLSGIHKEENVKRKLKFKVDNKKTSMKYFLILTHKVLFYQYQEKKHLKHINLKKMQNKRTFMLNNTNKNIKKNLLANIL